MALFGESKEDKKAKKVEELMERYGLQELSDPRDIKAVENIANKLASSNLINIGTAMVGGLPQDVGKMSLLQAIVEQNWIIIRQLDKLNSK